MISEKVSVSRSSAGESACHQHGKGAKRPSQIEEIDWCRLVKEVRAFHV
jgi:hypothetical protein